MNPNDLFVALAQQPLFWVLGFLAVVMCAAGFVGRWQ